MKRVSIFIFLSSIFLLSACNSKPDTESTAEKNNVTKISKTSDSVKNNEGDDKSNSTSTISSESKDKDKGNIETLSDVDLRKYVYLSYSKIDGASGDLNDKSYDKKITISSKENGTSGEILILEDKYVSGKYLISYTISPKGDIAFRKTGTSDRNSNIFEKVSKNELNTVRNTLEKYSYRAITTNPDRFNVFIGDYYREKINYSPSGGDFGKVTDFGNLSILPEYARSNPDFIVAALVSAPGSPGLIAATLDEIYTGSAQIIAPPAGETSSANWKVDDELTNALHIYFDKN